MTTQASAPRILVIEDDPLLNEQITSLLISQGYIVDCCFDGERGLNMALQKTYQMVLLDVMLPNRNGFSVLNILRTNQSTPIVLVTAKGAEEERIQGLSKGADDYIAKPFHPDELLLRIEAILRRCLPAKRSADEHIISVEHLILDQNEKSATVNGKALELTQIQFKLLRVLMQNQGETLSKAFLYQTVLKKSYSIHDRSLDMHLSRIRKKLSLANWNGERLQTVHGKGYCLS